MEHQSLYRRYRSQKFSELRGQEHVVRALQNAVREDRVGHAYLLSGPRGTGKTSAARILAKALNCTNLQDGEPCCACESCLAIESGRSFDLHELDAASNNKVDDMRDLLAKVHLGTPGRTKVYLLDEVHMLTAGAENALLKTLEEPPDHVVFVLATTEPHKVVPTIRSRTQHLELTLIPSGELAEHVRWIATDAGLDVDDAAIDHVIRVGGGSARDTLSALDQVIAAGGVSTDDDATTEILEALATSDPGRALAAVSEATRRGKDPRVIGESALSALREIFLTVMGAVPAELSEADRARAEQFVGRLSAGRLTGALELIGTALVEMRQSPDARVDLEVALVRLTNVGPAAGGGADADTGPLLEQIAALEARVAELEQRPAAATAPTGRSSAGGPPPTPPRATKRGPAEAARQRLAEQAAKPDGPPPAPSAPPDAPATPTEPPVDVEPPVASPAPAAPQPPQPPVDPVPAEPAPVAPAEEPPAPAAAPASGPLDIDTVQAAWSSLQESISKRARARFAAGSFTAVTDDTATFALPNEQHMRRCEECLEEVQAAVSTQLGRPLRMQLVADASVNAAPSRPAPSATPAAAPPPPPEPDDQVDLSELTDAPASSGSTAVVDRLQNAFPGAELVEEPPERT